MSDTTSVRLADKGRSCSHANALPAKLWHWRSTSTYIHAIDSSLAYVHTQDIQISTPHPRHTPTLSVAIKWKTCLSGLLQREARAM